MPRRIVILIPPSEGKAAGGGGAPWTEGRMAVAELDPLRSRVVAAVDGAALDPTGPTMAAIDRYTGVLYRELDGPALRGQARRRLDRDVLIVSGLWGLVAPRDPLPAYRLKMSASVSGLGRMATFWKPDLTAALAPRVRGAEVWDLLPKEHAAAVDWSRLAPARRTTIRFVDRSDSVVSHWNKLLKGSVVRWLAETGNRAPEQLADFAHPCGYRFEPLTSQMAADRAAIVMREQL